MGTREKAYLVIELDLAHDRSPLLVLKSVGIYGADHMNLTRNLKYVGATVFTGEGDTYEEAEKRVKDWVHAVEHLPAWKSLAETLRGRR